ncbi:hypothetical protein THAOC_11305 [Thalassiosira oceanica]|uniref:Uncharacterized protein n=1 Tax=Thalassiosira oceanica TaxID=159749 RepID=K0SRN9_THAOC|nr:hypothetical protein THAOC_11305 [Thalassiosira oceanica]|eukprot:EJK67634.1 hypothetical protein THAOC_11305 [Thalassiosira oceanica]
MQRHRRVGDSGGMIGRYMPLVDGRPSREVDSRPLLSKLESVKSIRFRATARSWKGGSPVLRAKRRYVDFCDFLAPVVLRRDWLRRGVGAGVTYTLFASRIASLSVSSEAVKASCHHRPLVCAVRGVRSHPVFWQRWTTAETEIMNAAASAWASGPIRSRSRAGIPSARTASAEEGQRKRCPLCRAAIPPSQEQVANYKMVKALTKDTSGPRYELNAREVKRFEAEFGEDWDGTMIEYDRDFVDLPLYVANAAYSDDFRTVLQWLNKGNLKERANAKCKDGGYISLLYFAATEKQPDLMSYLLLNGADVNILDSRGASVLTSFCLVEDNLSETVRLLLSWGAELIEKGEQVTCQEVKLSLCYEIATTGNIEIANLMSSELGGRRCEIVSGPKTRDDLVGKTCVVEDYVEISDQYKVRMEFTNEELLLGVGDLKRRDRTPQDPGYYVECKNNRLKRRDFKSNEECRAFVSSLGSDEEESSEVDPDADAKAEQAAADLLAELGLEDLEGPNSSASKKNNQPAASGKKKKRGGKKKGRK